MYTLKNLAQITGLSDRTLRNYLNSGILQGQKENGTWTFTTQQLVDFLQKDTVKAAVQAKKRTIINDFWNDNRKNKNSICMIWDLPETDPMKLVHFICDVVNQRKGITMSFESHNQKNRIILSGNEDDIFDILTEYRRTFT